MRGSPCTALVILYIIYGYHFAIHMLIGMKYLDADFINFACRKPAECFILSGFFQCGHAITASPLCKVRELKDDWCTKY